MGLHKSYDRDFMLIGGNTMTTGRSLNLAKGQFGIFDVQKTNKDGAKAVSSFAGLPGDQLFELRLGKSDLPVTRSQANKSYSSFPFSLGAVERLTVSAPENTEQKVDEVLIGYNGIDDATAITFDKGDKKKMVVNLRGEAISLLGYNAEGVNIPVYMDSEDCYPVDPDNCINCDACAEDDSRRIILDAVETLKNHQLRGGILASEFIDVSPVKSCDVVEDPALAQNPYNFYSLAVCDTGDESALSLVKSQYPDYTVTRISREGSTSNYQILVVDGDTPADYSQSIASIIKGCEDCPAGYTEVEGGLLYAVTLEDEGVDESATIETLANAAAGTAVKADGQLGGIGYYTVILTASLSDADFATFLTANPTSTIKEVGAVEAICDNATVTDIAWAVGEQCNVAEKSFEIALPDNDCGEPRLAELQAFYPNLTVGIDTSVLFTITAGTTGTADVEIGANSYSVDGTAGTPTQIATAFVTAEAANILAADGYVVTDNADGSFTVVGNNTGEVIAFGNITDDLAATVVSTNVGSGGCQTKYNTTVETNLVCDECDPIFKEEFIAEEPAMFEMREWTAVAPTTEESACKMGIKIKGKVFEVSPDECLRDEIGFSDSSTLVKVSGGFLTEVREGLGQLSDSPFHTEYLSRMERRTHLGGNLFDSEDRSRAFFTGENRHVGNNVAKMFKGEESNLDPSKQYVSYGLKIRREGHSQSFSGRSSSAITYNIYAEVGRHQALESVLNSIATSAGISPVQAFAKA